MKFKCDGRSLAQMLAKMIKVASRKAAGAPQAVLQMIASMAGLLKLVIVGDGVTLTTEVPAIVDVSGQVFVPPTALSDVVRAIVPLGFPIQFEHDLNAQQVRIVSGPVQQAVATLPIDVAPVGVANADDQSEVLRVPMRRLKQALDQLAPLLAAGSDFGGSTDVSLDVDADDRCTLVATDSVRLAMIGVQGALRSSTGTPCSWNLKLPDVRLLAAVLSGELGAEDEVVIQLGTTAWAASWSGGTLTALLSERSFPNWRAIRPRDFTNTIETDAKELAGILKLLTKVGDTKRATVKFRWNGDAHASLVAGNREAGTETDVALGISWKTRAAAPGSELAISAKLLEPLLKKLEPGRVHFSFTSPSLPAMVRPVCETEPVEFLIMPINL